MAKRAPVAKEDPTEEIIELHLEVQDLEKQFKECVDIGTFILRQYKEQEEINRQRNDESKMSMSFSDKGAEMSNMRESVRQYELELAD